MKNAYIKGKINESDRMCNLWKLVEAYCVHLRSIGQSGNTVRIKKKSIERFYLLSEIENIGDADGNMLEDHRVCLNKSGLSESTVDIHMRSLKDFFKYLEKKNLIFDNPFRNIKLYAVKCRKMDILSKHEVNMLLSLPPDKSRIYLRNRALFETLYSTAMRRGEITNLQIRDIDLATRTVRVIGKGRKERILPLGKKASEYIDGYLVSGRPRLIDPENPNCDDLWLDRFGGKMKKEAIQMLLVGAGKRAGIGRRVSCHMLRRTCVTHMLDNGAHPVMISQMLGHSCIRTLSHYLNISMKELMKTHSKSRLGK